MNVETLSLMNEIDCVFTKYPFFGSRHIAAYLPRNGFARRPPSIALTWFALQTMYGASAV
jgi:putative transposase